MTTRLALFLAPAFSRRLQGTIAARPPTRFSIHDFRTWPQGVIGAASFFPRASPKREIFYVYFLFITATITFHCCYYYFSDLLGSSLPMIYRILSRFKHDDDVIEPRPYAAFSRPSYRRVISRSPVMI